MNRNSCSLLLFAAALALAPGCQHTQQRELEDEIERKNARIARLEGAVGWRDDTIENLDDALIHASLNQIHNVTLRQRGKEPKVVIGDIEVYADKHKAPSLKGNVLVVQTGTRRRVRATCRECVVSGETLLLKGQPLLVKGGWNSPEIVIGTSHNAEFILDALGFAQKGAMVKRRIESDRSDSTIRAIWYEPGD